MRTLERIIRSEPPQEWEIRAGVDPGTWERERVENAELLAFLVRERRRLLAERRRG